MQNHPHYNCPLTPAEHEPMKRNGRGHRPGCQVADGHDSGFAGECAACKLLRDDAGKIRGHHLRREFGITSTTYEEMTVRQNGVCAICQKPNPNGNRLAVDHNHKTKKVRGLLCGTCNRALGLFGDDSGLMRKAAEYVEGHAE
jgi:hypothetical protein